MVKLVKLFIILFLFSACTSSTDKHAETPKYFFDIAGYFNQQAKLLVNKPVVKTVSKNGAAETKTILVKNWDQELQLFSECDINKAAWKDSYTADSTVNQITYTATDPELKVRLIKISFNKKTPNKIEITTQSKNILYHTTEDLIYIPDSLYQITKHQKVILLGLNDYKISGKL